jgi:uncharacterized protein
VTATHGRFTWYELLTTDMKAAKAFYAHVVGWGAHDAGDPGGAYTFFTINQTPVGGLMPLPDEVRRRGGSPCWIGYVAVDDVDAAVARVRERGGTIYLPPTDVPGVSRVAVVTDPQMTTIALTKWLIPPEEPPAAWGNPGRVGWHELLAANGDKAFAFYSELFGWQTAGIEKAAEGTYQLIATGEQTLGGIFTKPAPVTRPFWLFYFSVDNIDAAVERVKAGGGTILEGPGAVPGGWIVRCEDPQGVTFALMGERTSKAVGYFERSPPRDRTEPRGKRWYW